MGKRGSERQAEMWIAAAQMPVGSGHFFHRKLKQLLAAHGFDAFPGDVPQVVLREHGPPEHSAGCSLPDAAHRLLRGHRLRTPHCMALCPLANAERVARLWADGDHA